MNARLANGAFVLLLSVPLYAAAQASARPRRPSRWRRTRTPTCVARPDR
jgi:hypothetical protein